MNFRAFLTRKDFFEKSLLALAALILLGCVLFLFLLADILLSPPPAQQSTSEGTLQKSSTPTASPTPRPTRTTRTPRPSVTGLSPVRERATRDAGLRLTGTFQALSATPTITPTRLTFTPTLNLTLTSTSQPPLQAHTWEVEQVMVSVWTGCGDGECNWISPPSLILYGDGLFIRSQSNGSYDSRMIGRKLKRQEACQLLNTIDQSGFLDYDPSVYRDPMDGLPYTHIDVHSWKSKEAYGQTLRNWIFEGVDWWRKDCPSEECAYPPVILPALSKTYKLLDIYNPGTLSWLKPTRMVIWLIPLEESWLSTEEAQSVKKWLFSSISLQQLLDLAATNESFQVEIDDLGLVQALDEGMVSGIYRQGDLLARVNMRPMWPHEDLERYGWSNIPIGEVVPPGTTLSCSPEDGVLPVPK